MKVLGGSSILMISGTLIWMTIKGFPLEVLEQSKLWEQSKLLYLICFHKHCYFQTIICHLMMDFMLIPGSIKPEYLNVYVYHDCYHTYENDAVYVKYYGEISKKIKWIEEFLHLDDRSAKWRDMEIRGWRQALRIATNLPQMTLRLASFVYKEYISELRKDASLEGLDLVFFEIWRRVVKEKKSYMDAVKEVHAVEKFHMHKCTMEAELAGAPVFWTMKQRIYGIILESDIVANTEDSKARDLFRKGVARLKKRTW